MDATHPLRTLFTWRLPGGIDTDPSDERYRLERVLATARLALVGTALAAASFESSILANERLLWRLLAIYLAQAILVYGFLVIRGSASTRLCITLHALDVVWGATVMLVTAAGTSLFVFPAFALFAAAYRWGLWETLATTSAAVGIVVVEANVWQLPGGDGGLPSMVTRLSFIVIAGVLLGYLAEEAKELRAEEQKIARIMTGLQCETSLGQAFRFVASELRQTFGTARLAVAIKEIDSGRAYLWNADTTRKPHELPAGSFRIQETDHATYFFDMPAPAWLAVRRHAATGQARPSSADFRVQLEPAISARSGDPLVLPDAFLEAHGADTLMCVTFEVGVEWTCRAFLMNVPRRIANRNSVRLLQRLFVQASPSIYSIYLVRRLRSRAGALERSRVARELHDGVIQSLFSVEMQLDVLRRRAAQGEMVGNDLEHIQGLVHQEVISLRELMQQMRPVEVTPKDFLDYLAGMVDRFGRDTGIAARFISGLHEVPLTARICRELTLIVQEALINVRKHSGARNVVVRLTDERGTWKLVIDEDGRGFPFEGRFTQEALDARRQGPVVIKERVRAIGGELTLDSSPGRGSRLEIALPQVARG